jgi:hypothetical protein
LGNNPKLILSLCYSCLVTAKIRAKIYANFARKADVCDIFKNGANQNEYVTIVGGESVASEMQIPT